MSKELIPGYPKGRNLVILNTNYDRGHKQDDGKWSNDMLTVLFKDLDTNKKHIAQIENPEYTFYTTKDDVYVDDNLFFIEKEKVNPVTVPYKDVVKTIAGLYGEEGLQEYYNNIKSGNRRANNDFHTLPNIFNSDMDIQDHFRFQFSLNYTNDPSYVPTKAYSDIETDTNYQQGDFPEMGEVPINSISYIDQAHKKIICFCWIDVENNPSAVEFEEYAKYNDVAAECKEFCENHIGKKYAKKYKLLDFNYEFVFYHDEAQMLIDFYKVVNYYEPDIMMYWNGAGFDNPYIVERLKVLGLDPSQVVSKSYVKEKMCKCYIDERNKALPAQRGDWTFFTNHTVVIDQMIQFASRRKGQSAFDNMKLDNIARLIAKVGKLDWSKRFRTFSQFIRGDFKMFSFYNVCDTLAQYCVEFMVSDMDYMVSKCLMNNTRYEKCHRQTVYLTNRCTAEFEKEGFIIGNNHNRNNEKPPKFPGALVGDPTHNNDFAKLKICGQVVNICNNLDDFDYKSLYPSIMREFNIAPNTQIGKILIDQQVWKGENPFKYGKYCRGGQFIEDYNSDNVIEFSKRWFHLAGYEEMLEDMKEYFAEHKPYGRMNPIEETDLIRHYDILPSKSLINRIEYDHKESLIVVYPEKRSFNKEIAWLKENAQMDLNNVEQILARKLREAEEDAELEKVFTELEDPNKIAALAAKGEEEDND